MVVDVGNWDVGTSGQTAERVWRTLLPALRLLDLRRTRVWVKCRVERMELRFEVGDAGAAEGAIRGFFAAAADEGMEGGQRLGKCLGIVPLIRGFRWEG